MEKWKKMTALLMIPALLGLQSCTGATGAASGEAGAASTASEETALQESGEGSTAGAAAEKEEFDGKMHFENGMAQPMLNYSTVDTPNDKSDILRLCVYVETDHDTDGDGKADLVKAFVQVPKSAVEGKYKAAAIYDPTPYPAGVYEKTLGYLTYPYAEDSFDYNKLYQEGAKRETSERISTMDAAAKANSSDWIYNVAGTEYGGYYFSGMYDYFLVRGFAVVEACGIGTYGSEGFELCGTDLERDSHKCVVEWLTGDRPAFTDKENNVEIRADWCSGNVAMTGCSYGGTLPYEVATTGVKGLKTIIPVAGISNWYDYTNSQGVSRTSEPHYTDHLSAYNAGSLFLDDNWTVPNEEYGAYLKQLTKDERAANGNYEGTWTKMDYSDDYENIACSALIVHGLNDFNVLTKQSDLMYKAFKKAGQNVKIIWHQDGHNILHGRYVGDELYDELANKWLSHYLYDVKNGIEDMAEVMVQSNVDGTYKSYDSWGEAAGSLTAKPAAEGETEIKSGTFDDYYVKYGKDKKPEEAYCEDVDAEHAATYTLDVPAGTTIYGVPEVHVRLKTPDVSGDNLMVTAKLIDTSADGKPIKVYLTNGNIQNVVPFKTIGEYEIGGGAPAKKVRELVKSSMKIKIFSEGWADLMDPGTGYISSENPSHTATEADTYYDYTLYLTPTVYTVEEGHTLKLMIYAQDPGLTRGDSVEDDTPYFDDNKVDEVYSFTIDNASVEVVLPVDK